MPGGSYIANRVRLPADAITPATATGSPPPSRGVGRHGSRRRVDIDNVNASGKKWRDCGESSTTDTFICISYRKIAKKETERGSHPVIWVSSPPERQYKLFGQLSAIGRNRREGCGNVNRKLDAFSVRPSTGSQPRSGLQHSTVEPLANWRRIGWKVRRVF